MSAATHSIFPCETRQRSSGKRAVALVKYILGEYFVIFEVPDESDYGIDLFLTGKKGSYVVETTFPCQVKSTEVRSGPSIIEYIPLKSVLHSFSLGGGYCVYLFVDLKRTVIYWYILTTFDLIRDKSDRIRVEFDPRAILYDGKQIRVDHLLLGIRAATRVCDMFQVNIEPPKPVSDLFWSSLLIPSRSQPYIKFETLNSTLLSTVKEIKAKPDDRNIILKAFTVSDIVVDHSVRNQIRWLQHLMETDSSKLICIDTELDIRGAGSWLSQNWANEFGSACAEINRNRKTPLQVSRIYVLSNPSFYLYYRNSLRDLATIFSACLSQGIRPYVCTRDWLEIKGIPFSVGDCWCVSNQLLVLNSPPLYFAQAYGAGSDLMIHYSPVLTQLIDHENQSGNQVGCLFISSADESTIRSVLENISIPPVSG